LKATVPVLRRQPIAGRLCGKGAFGDIDVERRRERDLLAVVGMIVSTGDGAVPDGTSA